MAFTTKLNVSQQLLDVPDSPAYAQQSLHRLNQFL
jgi:hypothetical protein